MTDRRTPGAHSGDFLEPINKRRKRSYLLALLLLMLSCIVPALGTETLSEFEVMSALFYNFASYVEWPNVPETRKPEFCLGVYGAPEMLPVLRATLEGEIISRRKVIVKEIGHPRDTRECDMVFISKTALKVQEVMDLLHSSPVLTVGNAPDFLSQGGCISFFPENGKFRFSVNLTNVKKSGLKISSRLLKLARKVIE